MEKGYQTTGDSTKRTSELPRGLEHKLTSGYRRVTLDKAEIDYLGEKIYGRTLY